MPRPLKPIGALKRTARGYVLIKTPKGPWVYQHRYVLETWLDRELKDTEIVKWKDGNPTNNEIENLEIWELQRTWPNELQTPSD